MTTKFINVVCKLESEYGSVLNIPDDNPVLVKIQRYWKSHPEKITYESYEDLDVGRIQRMLDKGYPKSYIGQVLDIPPEVINARIVNGKLSDDKWKHNKLRLKHNYVYAMYRNNSFISNGTIEELTKKTGKTIETLKHFRHANDHTLYRMEKIGDNAEWVKIRWEF